MSKCHEADMCCDGTLERIAKSKTIARARNLNS
jgi:hypothetical protein